MITESDPIHIGLDLPGINCDKPLDPSGKQLTPPLPQCNHTLLFIGNSLASGNNATLANYVVGSPS